MQYDSQDKLTHPKFLSEKLSEEEESDESNLPALSKENHDNLLKYLTIRLQSNQDRRSEMVTRFGRIDKKISTWQKRTHEESERLTDEENTGRVQGIGAILPMLVVHLDDTVGFFSEIFTPEARDVYVVPSGDDGEVDEAAKMLAKHMNRDTRFGGLHSELAKTLRSLLKYNVGGLEVSWQGKTDESEERNETRTVDMYNVSWDPTVSDVHRVASTAEWVALFDVVNTKTLFQWGQNRGWDMTRVKKCLRKTSAGQSVSPSHSVTHYVCPYRESGVESDGQDSKSGRRSTGYFNSNNVSNTKIHESGYEYTRMYCWLDMNDFGASQTESRSSYELYLIHIIDQKHIVHYERVPMAGTQSADDETIPVYLAHYIQDDLGLAQKSPMELMVVFQRFASFLLAVWTQMARKKLYGVKFYDPDVIDPESFQEGQVSGWIPVKLKGRDIRSAVSELADSSGVMNDVMQMIQQVLSLTQLLFPSQALPSQIAGIDRAVERQVSAVMNTGMSRLRFQTRLLDTTLLMPVRKQQFRNLSRYSEQKYSSLTAEVVNEILGSGLKSLNAERTENFLKEVLRFAGTSEEFMQQADMMKILDQMTASMNLGFSFTDMLREPQQELPNPETTAEDLLAAEVAQQRS